MGAITAFNELKKKKALRQLPQVAARKDERRLHKN